MRYAQRVQVVQAVDQLGKQGASELLGEAVGVLDEAENLPEFRETHRVVADICFSLHFL